MLADRAKCSASVRSSLNAGPRAIVVEAGRRVSLFADWPGLGEQPGLRAAETKKGLAQEKRNRKRDREREREREKPNMEIHTEREGERDVYIYI